MPFRPLLFVPHNSSLYISSQSLQNEKKMGRLVRGRNIKGRNVGVPLSLSPVDKEEDNDFIL